MADITLKLIWYRLNETYSKMAEAGANMETWFNWEEHFLDVLLLFWISVGLLIVGLSNSLTQFFGPLQPRISWDKGRDLLSNRSVVEGPTKPESTFWLNQALNWFYLHYNSLPEFVDSWIQSLNDQAVKLGGPVQIKFEKVESGSLPPKFGEVTYDAGPEDKYVLNSRVDSRDLSFAVFASQQTHEGVKLTNLTVTVLKLRGHLKIHCYRKKNDMMADISFQGRPDIKVQGKPSNPYQDPSDLVDVGVVEEVVRNTICLTSTTFNVSQWIAGSNRQCEVIPIQRQRSNEMSRSTEPQQPPSPRPMKQQQQVQLQQVFEPSPPPVFEPQQVFESIEVQEAPKQQSAFHVPTIATPPKQTPQRPQAQRLGVDKRLLTKVIKASGLNQNAGSVDPYCVVYVDTPPQSEVTSVVRSTFNPFWDEQFFFDLTKDSQQIRFEILDRHRPANDNFLGEAVVYCEDLQRNPSSRQIIPLQGRLGAGEFVTGSITVEFLCTDPEDTANMADALSPRRTIETSKSVTPEGTVITTTTTTTQKPHNSRLDANIDSSPNYVEKRGFEYEPIDPDRSSSEVIRINGVESVADTAIRALSERPKQRKTPVKTSTLIITGVKREPAVPVIKTIESSPTDEDEGRHMTISSTGSPEVNVPKEQTKEKKSLASRIKKRFSRSKKRSQSADRARSTSSLREGSNYLRPPPGPQSKDGCSIDSDNSLTTIETSFSSIRGGRSLSLRSGSVSNSSVNDAGDDIDLYRKKKEPETPNLKKSKSLGGSLKKLFRRSRKRSRSMGRDGQSRESSVSRQSRHTSQVPSREGSLTRSSYTTNQHDTVIL